MTKNHWSEELTELAGAETHAVFEEDTGGPYEFDAVAIVKNRGAYHVVSSSGCSCPSHEEQAQHDAGPFDTYAEALTHVPDSHRGAFPVSEPAQSDE